MSDKYPTHISQCPFAGSCGHCTQLRHELDALRSQVTYLASEVRQGRSRVASSYESSIRSLERQLEALREEAQALRTANTELEAETMSLKLLLLSHGIQIPSKPPGPPEDNNIPSLVSSQDPTTTTSPVKQPHTPALAEIPTKLPEELQEAMKEPQLPDNRNVLSAGSTPLTGSHRLMIDDISPLLSAVHSPELTAHQLQHQPQRRTQQQRENEFVRAVLSVMTQPNFNQPELTFDEALRKIECNDIPPVGSKSTVDDACKYFGADGAPKGATSEAFVLPPQSMPTAGGAEELSEDFDKQLVAVGKRLLLDLTGVGLDDRSSSSDRAVSSTISRGSTSASASKPALSSSPSANPGSVGDSMDQITRELEGQFGVAKALLTSQSLEGLSRRLHELNPTLFPRYESGERVDGGEDLGSSDGNHTLSSTYIFESVRKAARSLMSAVSALGNGSTSTTWADSPEIAKLVQSNMGTVARAQQLSAELEEHKKQIAARVAKIQDERDPTKYRERVLEQRRELVARYLYRLYQEAEEVERQRREEETRAALCPVTQLRALKEKFL